jgi:hypothetical protein
MPRASRSARLVTLAISITSVAVAMLAARPRSSLTPPLVPGDTPVSFLEGAARSLGLDGLSPDAAAWVAGAAVAAVVCAFLAALVLAWRGEITLRRVLWLAAALHVLVLVVPLLLSRDVYSYALYGRLFADGLNPYVAAPAALAAEPLLPFASPQWVDSPSVYGPGFTLLSAGLASMLRSPVAVVRGFELLVVASSLGTVALVMAAARRARPERAAFAGVLVGWNPLVLFHTVGGGHNDALVGAAVAGAAVLILSGRRRPATLVLALGTVVKLTAAVPLAVAVAVGAAVAARGRRLRELGVHAAIVAAVAVPVSLPFVREDPTLGLAELATREGWMAPFRLLQRTARALGAAPGPAGTVLRVVLAAVVVTAVVVVVRHLLRAGADAVATVAAMGWVTLIGLLGGPALLPWYLPVLLPVAWILPRGPRAATVVLSSVLAATLFVAEPGRSPVVWEAMVLAVRYVGAPVALALLVRLLLDLRSRLALGPVPGGPDPLVAEFPSASGAAAPQRVPAQPEERGHGRAPAGDREPGPVGDHPGQDEDPRAH